jgi:hypothetical protein
MVFIAQSKCDYLQKINLAISKSKQTGTVEQGIRISKAQSSEIRAKQFLTSVEGLY